MSANSLITGIGLLMLVMYVVIQILEFYGISINSYGSYLAFYAFIMITLYVLPTNYSRFTV